MKQNVWYAPWNKKKNYTDDFSRVSIANLISALHETMLEAWLSGSVEEQSDQELNDYMNASLLYLVDTIACVEQDCIDPDFGMEPASASHYWSYNNTLRKEGEKEDGNWHVMVLHNRYDCCYKLMVTANPEERKRWFKTSFREQIEVLNDYAFSSPELALVAKSAIESLLYEHRYYNGRSTSMWIKDEAWHAIRKIAVMNKKRLCDFLATCIEEDEANARAAARMMEGFIDEC